MPTLIRTDAELAARLPILEAAGEIAVDTEFHPERAYFPKVMLLQLRPGNGDALIIDVLGVERLAPLGKVLSGKTLLMHGGDADVGILARIAGVQPAAVFDTQVAAGFLGFGYPRSLRELVQRVLGKTIEKGETMSDWSRRPLSPDQLRYAAEDVLVLDPLVSTLRSRLAEAGREQMAHACMEERLLRLLAPPDDQEAWRKFSQAPLDDEERAALRQLAAWREAAGREADIPATGILHDGALLDLARRRPASLEAMKANRRLPGHVWRQHGNAVLTAIAAARGQSPPPAPRRGLPVDLLRLAARIAEADSGVSAELVLRDCELSYILDGNPPEGWRAEALGSDWLDFVHGRRTIAMPGRFV